RRAAAGLWRYGRHGGRSIARVGDVSPRGVPEVGVSCCVLILMDQSTEDVAATQPAEVRGTPCFGSLGRHRRRVGQAAVRAALVVMLDLDPQDTDKLMAADDQQLLKTVPPQRAATALALGARTGVQTTSAQVERHTSSNALVNMASRSRIRNLHAVARSPTPTTISRACCAPH